MNKKGFTFVEMLLVVAFIATLTLIMVPNLSGLFKQSNENKYNAFLSDIYLATEAYVQKNIEKYSTLEDIGGKAYIYMKDLVTSNYLKSTVINPHYCDDNNNCSSKKISTCDENGENCVVDDYTIVVTKGENGVYSYELFNGILSGEYKEEILNGAYPEISGDLIPVIIENDGTVKKANLSNKWYSYKNKEWANAVILVDNSITYESGDVIPESNIESYFVWVPRYKYKLFDLGEYTSVITGKPEASIAHPIEIVFGDDTTSDETEGECTTPLTSGGKGNCEIGDYMTHPAFITMNSNGLWVGKFETGYSGATSTAAAQVTSSDSSKIIVKPNVYSWRNNTLSNMFVAAYNYNRSLDSHMMKNTEWGAVAYLSHSEYGINSEINVNNNSNYMTGYSAVIGTDQSSYPGTYGIGSSVTLTYNTETGYKASTTGNITGVYDMSGGSEEYLSAYMGIGSSEFSSDPITLYGEKYFDVYLSNSTITSYNNRILGDATGEMGSFYSYEDNDSNYRYHNNWYSDHADVLYSSNTWFNRGGVFVDGILAGQFHFARNTGGVSSLVSSRLVLVG